MKKLGLFLLVCTVHWGIAVLPAYADSCNPSICDTGCSAICGEQGHSVVSASCCPDGICYCYCANEEAPPLGGCPS